MRYGILSDIHGNLDALETVLQAAPAVDQWLCLGDTVGYGPEPNECVDRVRALCQVTLIGNHDLAALDRLSLDWFNPHARAAAEWTQQQLSASSRTFLESLPETWIDRAGDVTFAHGSLTDPPRDYITTRSEARTNFKLLTTQALFIGHSHLSHSFTMEEGQEYCDEEVFHGRSRVEMRPKHCYIINAGSVGQPRDGDPRAAYGVFDTEARVAEVFRVRYDIDSVRRKMQNADLPALLSQRLLQGV